MKKKIIRLRIIYGKAGNEKLARDLLNLNLSQSVYLLVSVSLFFLRMTVELNVIRTGTSDVKSSTLSTSK